MNVTLKIIEVFEQVVSAIVCSGTIYLAIFKRKEIIDLFHALVSFSDQSSSVDLQIKLGKLSELDIRVSRAEILVLLSDIQGQVKMNDFLRSIAGPQLERITKITDGEEKLTSKSKANLVGELREILRTVPAYAIKNRVNK